MDTYGILTSDGESRVDTLIISQYKDSTNLKDYIKAFVKPIEEIKVANVDSINSRSIDMATGESLDKIAKVVGEDRVVRGAAALGFFGFDDNPSALGLSEGIFYSYGDKTTDDLVMSDPLLRSAIRARIIKNTSGGKIEDILKFCDLITDSELNTELTETKGGVHLRFHETLTPSARLLLSIRIRQITSVGVLVTLEDDTGTIEVVDV